MQRTSRLSHLGLGLGGLALCTVLSCGKAGPFVSLRVSGLPSETVKLRVTATFQGKPQTREIDIPMGQPPQEIPLSFDFPADTFDKLTVLADATDGACTLAKKEQSYTVDQNQFYDVGVLQLEPQPLAMCNFTTFPLTVKATLPEGGTVASDKPGIDCGANCTANFRPNTEVKLTARAKRGYRFTGWTPSSCSTTQDPNTCTLTMDQKKDVTATFELCQGAWCIETPSISTTTLNAVWGTSNSAIFAVGDSGTLLYFDGLDWRPQANPATPAAGMPLSLRTVGGPKSGTQIAVVAGANGTLMTVASTGSWETKNTNTMETWNGVGGQSPTSLYAIGTKGQVRWRNTDGTWPTPGLALGSPSGFQAANLHAITPFTGGKNRTIIVGAGGFCTVADQGILDYNIAFDNKDCKAGTKNLNGVWFGSQAGYVVGDEGFIASFTTGAVFTALATSPTGKNLRAVWGADDSVVYAVGEGGTILKRANNTWSVDTSPTTLDLNGVWAHPSGHAYAVGAGGIILHYYPAM